MDRITDKHLDGVVGRINRMTHSPETSYTMVNGKYTANPGNYHIDSAYGRVSLVQMCNDGGGIRRVFGSCTKRELYDQMHAFCSGIEAGRATLTAGDVRQLAEVTA